MFWNKDHFKQAGLDPEAAPENWDSFVSAAKAVTTDGRYGYTCDMGNPAGAYQNFLRALLLAGGELYDAQWNPQLNSEAGVEGLTKMVELLHLHKVMDPASLQITNASDLVEVFAQGNTSIVFNWPFQWAVANASGAKTAGVVGNGLIPGIGVRSASIDGSEGYAINVNSTNKAAAMKWLEFASSNVAQKQIVEKEGWFPVSKATLADPATVERARARLAGVRGAVVRRADVLDPALRGEVGVFRTVTCVAVLHHLPLEEGLRALSGFVAPGGRLCVVGLAADGGPGDRALSALSVLPNWVASRWHREVRDIGVPVAPPCESLREIRAVAARVLPGCRLRRRMYWRYRLTWDRPGAA